MDTDKLAIYLLASVHLLVAIVCAFLLARDFVRKHRRGLTKRTPDVACASTYHNAFIIVYRHCPVCGGNTPRG